MVCLFLGSNEQLTFQLYFSSLLLAPSAAPSGLTVNFISSTAVSLKWNPLDEDGLNGILQYYTIELDNIETGQVVLLATVHTTIDINSLHPYYNYVCRVAAVTVSSGPEANIVFQMPEDGRNRSLIVLLYVVVLLYYQANLSIYVVPTSPPTSLRIAHITSTTAEAYWNPPPNTEQNGNITSYTLVLINSKTNQIALLSTSAASLSLALLSPYTVYSVAVSANTSVGMGPFTAYTTFSTLEAGKLTLKLYRSYSFL